MVIKKFGKIPIFVANSVYIESCGRIYKKMEIFCNHRVWGTIILNFYSATLHTNLGTLHIIKSALPAPCYKKVLVLDRKMFYFH